MFLSHDWVQMKSVFKCVKERGYLGTKWEEERFTYRVRKEFIEYLLWSVERGWRNLKWLIVWDLVLLKASTSVEYSSGVCCVSTMVSGKGKDKFEYGVFEVADSWKQSPVESKHIYQIVIIDLCLYSLKMTQGIELFSPVLKRFWLACYLFYFYYAVCSLLCLRIQMKMIL